MGGCTIGLSRSGACAQMVWSQGHRGRWFATAGGGGRPSPAALGGERRGHGRCAAATKGARAPRAAHEAPACARGKPAVPVPQRGRARARVFAVRSQARTRMRGVSSSAQRVLAVRRSRASLFWLHRVHAAAATGRRCVLDVRHASAEQAGGAPVCLPAWARLLHGRQAWPVQQAHIRSRARVCGRRAHRLAGAGAARPGTASGQAGSRVGAVGGRAVGTRGQWVNHSTWPCCAGLCCGHAGCGMKGNVAQHTNWEGEGATPLG